MKKRIIILGSGPNRIGQSIEFDYACVQAVLALQEEGYEAIMVNCNPETVSTDYDISDRLYFEPIVYEHVIDIIKREEPEGVLIQFGGQTPLKLSLALEKQGIRILGTSPRSIDIAEDRELFRSFISRMGIKQPESGTARSVDEAKAIAKNIGYPVLVRPSYVLGGRAMKIIYDEEELIKYIGEAVEVSFERPILIDKFLEDSVELDVDAVADGEDVLIGAIMEHIEEAGVHSGDSAASIPPYSLSEDILLRIKEYTKKIAKELNVCGLINIQYAVKGNEVYILELNPRASRTVPFVSKSVGYPLARIAAKIAVGRKLRDIVGEVFDRVEKGETHPASDFLPKDRIFYSVKEVVFPWNRFPEVDPVLGPEMRSTGEVMGIDRDFGMAFYKAQLAAGNSLPLEGTVFISVADRDKPKIVELAKGFIDLGFKVCSTKGTHKFLSEKGIKCELVLKVSEGRPHVVDMISNGKIDMVINTPSGKRERSDAYFIRRSAVQHKIPYTTTVRGGYAMLEAVKSFKKRGDFEVFALQDLF